jgi:hypothetical protein
MQVTTTRAQPDDVSTRERRQMKHLFLFDVDDDDEDEAANLPYQ